MRTYLLAAKRCLLCVLLVSSMYFLNMSSRGASHDCLVFSAKAERFAGPIAAPSFTQSHFTGYVKGNNVGLVNATVSLLDANNTVIATGMTDADGLYSILITTPTCTVPPPTYRTIATVPTWTMNRDGGSHVGCPGVFPPESVVFADIVMIRVIAVQWENVYTGQLADNPKNLGDGKRMFPDKPTPTDTPTTPRRVIKIVAGVTQPQAVANIYVKVFDVDDPSSSLDVDPNGPLGTDNRGIDSSPMQTTIQVTGNNPSGIVFFTTTMYAGDNFVVAASTDSNYLNGITIDGTGLIDTAGNPIPINSANPSTAKRTEMLTVWRRLHIEADSMGIVANNFASGALISANSVFPGVTELTTSLSFSESNQFESGSINILGLGTYSVSSNGNGAAVVIVQGNLTTRQVAGKSFTLYDDDDFDSSGMKDADNGTNVEPHNETFDLMQESDDTTKNVFAAAYVMPIRDGAGNAGNNNNETNIAFNPNIELTTNSYDPQIAFGKNSVNVESDDYWVAYLQVGYQGPVAEDADPNYSGNIIFDTYTAGVSKTTSKVDSVAGTPQNPPVMPLGADDSFAFVEVIRDVFAFLGFSSTLQVAPHEIGHQFGLKGDTVSAQSGGSNDYGIMSYGSTLDFVPAHINILRWRKKSPGH